MATGSDSEGYIDPRGRTTRLEPIPDRVEPVNFPYRGGQQHGVAVEGRPWIPKDAEAQSWEGEEVYTNEPPPLEPVPVFIVSEAATEIRSWRAWHHIASVTPSLIVGQNPQRTSVRIRNMDIAGGGTVFISHDSNVSIYSAYPILAGDELRIDTEEEVYCAIEASDDPVELAVLSEHAVI